MNRQYLLTCMSVVSGTRLAASTAIIARKTSIARPASHLLIMRPELELQCADVRARTMNVRVEEGMFLG